MAVVYIGNGIYLGLAADTKPTSGVATNAIFITTDKPTIHYYNGSAWTTDIPNISTANTFTAVQAIDVAAGYILALKRPTSTAGLDVGIEFLEHNSSSAMVRYAALLGGIVENTAGAFKGNLKFQTANAGVVATVLKTDEIGDLTIGRSQFLKISESGLTALRTITFPNATTKLLGESTGFKTSRSTKTFAQSPYTLLDTDSVIMGDATSGNITFNLPPASTRDGVRYTIMKIDGSVNTVTIDANSTELINSAETLVLATQYKAVTICCDGTKWFKISEAT